MLQLQYQQWTLPPMPCNSVILKLKNNHSQLYPLFCKRQGFISFYVWVVFNSVYISHFIQSSICRQLNWYQLSYRELNCYKHGCWVHFCWVHYAEFIFGGVGDKFLRMGWLSYMAKLSSHKKANIKHLPWGQRQREGERRPQHQPTCIKKQLKNHCFLNVFPDLWYLL